LDGEFPCVRDSGPTKRVVMNRLARRKQKKRERRRDREESTHELKIGNII